MSLAEAYGALIARIETLPDYAQETLVRRYPSATDADLAAMDSLMRARLGCPLPPQLAAWLRVADGVNVQSTKLFGTDHIAADTPKRWIKQGIVYATETYFDDARASDILIVGSDDLILLALTKDGSQAFVLNRGTLARKPAGSLADMISAQLREMTTDLGDPADYVADDD